MSNKKDILSTLTQHTKIELGLILSLLAIAGSGLVFIAKSLAEIQDHGNRLTRSEVRIDKLEKMANDVSYLKGRFDAEFPPKKSLNNGD